MHLRDMLREGKSFQEGAYGEVKGPYMCLRSNYLHTQIHLVVRLSL